MKKFIVITLAVVLVLTLVVGSGLALAKPNGNGPKPGTDFNGSHYNLNLIGKNKVMPGDYDNPDRHTMFIPLDTSEFDINLKTPNNLDETTLPGIKINITQGEEWAMIDGNATDGEGSFQMAPGKYDVYIAVKAKSPKYPDAYTDITGWVEAYDNVGTLWYYLNVGSVTVSKGKNKWTDASTLLWVSDSEDPFGIVGANDVWVFDYMNMLDTWTDGGYDFSDLAYFWQVDNHGNKLIQVRFYEH